MAITLNFENVSTTVDTDIKNIMNWTGSSPGTTNLFNVTSASSIYRSFYIFSGPRLPLSQTNDGMAANGWPSNIIALNTWGNTLVKWYNANDTSNMTYDANTMTLRLNPEFFPLTAVTNSGTATWFAFIASGPATQYYGIVTGTVGLPGSGADLIMPNTTVTAGQELEIPDGMIFNPVLGFNPL